jgi:hypothetical protein
LTVEWEKGLEQFQQEAQRLKAGWRSGSLPFPEVLRAFAVRPGQWAWRRLARVYCAQGA